MPYDADGTARRALPGARLNEALARLTSAVRTKAPPREQGRPVASWVAVAQPMRATEHVGWLAYLFGRLGRR